MDLALQPMVLDGAGLACRVTLCATCPCVPEAHDHFAATAKYHACVSHTRDTPLPAYVVFAASVLHLLAPLMPAPQDFARTEAATLASLLASLHPRVVDARPQEHPSDGVQHAHRDRRGIVVLALIRDNTADDVDDLEALLAPGRIGGQRVPRPRMCWAPSGASWSWRSFADR